MYVICTTFVPGACRGQKNWVPLKLQMAVSHYVDLETEPMCSAIQVFLTTARERNEKAPVVELDCQDSKV